MGAAPPSEVAEFAVHRRIRMGLQPSPRPVALLVPALRKGWRVPRNPGSTDDRRQRSIKCSARYWIRSKASRTKSLRCRAFWTYQTCSVARLRRTLCAIDRACRHGSWTRSVEPNRKPPLEQSSQNWSAPLCSWLSITTGIGLRVS